jgi:FtsP/CotA-like multicopper oxidase with cupredoxin domain
MLFRHPRLVARAAPAALALALVLVAGACQPNARTEHVTVQATTIGGQPAFSVPTINAIRYQRVVIDVTNTTDHPRGFTLDGYDIAKTVDPGQHAVVDFKADKPGFFRIHDQVNPSAQDSRLVVAEA